MMYHVCDLVPGLGQFVVVELESAGYACLMLVYSRLFTT